MTVHPNCWEFFDCSFSPEAFDDPEHRVCPAMTEVRLHGVNHGTCGGRACWTVPGTLCHLGEHAVAGPRPDDCSACPFYQAVRRAEGKEFVGGLPA